ncbi:MAG TPA: type VI secretion system protein TssA [Bryobacteraceae bacterium]|nr:type VI secretion system protein TssA [Bryobacteraceae bacterium]
MPWRTDLLDPIAGDNPSGQDLRYDPIYLKITEARREEDRDPFGGPPKVADWAQVADLAGKALATRSKDLQLAVWLTEAMVRREGLPALHTGLKLIHGLLTNFWDTLYPELEDGDAELRATPLNQLALRLEIPIKFIPLNSAGHDLFKYEESRTVPYETDYDKAEIRQTAIQKQKKLPPEEWDKAFAETPKAFYKALVADIRESLAAIEALNALEDKFGEAAPSYVPLQKSLEKIGVYAELFLKQKLEVDPDPPEPEPVEEAEVGEEAEAVAEGALAAPGFAVEGGAAAAPARALTAEPTDREDAVARVAAAARYLRRAEPSNPAPYLMLRGLRWGEVRASHTPDQRMLEAPPAQKRTQLKTLLIDRRWAQLLEACEEAMALPCGRGWIDLQRYAITACAHLGKDYAAIEAALKDALRDYVTEVPRLLEMTMMDDTPAANSETQEWLRNEIGVGRGPERAAADPADNAMELARAGRTEDAIALIKAQLAQERSARGRFYRKTRLAAVLVESGQEAIALPILQDLAAEIEAHKLEDWESGDMVAEPLALLYRCLRKLNGDPALLESLYVRICRLDPLQALSCPV